MCRCSDGLNGMISALLSIGPTGNFRPRKSDETICEKILQGDSVGEVVCLVEMIRYPNTAQLYVNASLSNSTQLRNGTMLGKNSDDFNDATRIIPL